MTEPGNHQLTGDEHKRLRPLAEFQRKGLLWAINRYVLHPRGFALAFVLSPDDSDWMGDRQPDEAAVNRIERHLLGEDFVNIRAAIEKSPNGYTVVPKDLDVLGWTLLGDGTETWQFNSHDDDDAMGRFEAFIAEHRKQDSEPEASR